MPSGARVGPLLNKMNGPAEQPAARELAEKILSAGEIQRVVLASCGGKQFFCSVKGEASF